MFRGKRVKIILAEEANNEYQELNRIAIDENKRGIKSSEHQTLLRSINRVIDLLRQNPFAGSQVPKRQIPGKYILRYDAKNLWRIELSNYWRLIYTVSGNELEIIDFILDIVDHKEYNKIFGYK